MPDTLTAALTTLDKARTSARSAIADRAYRVCVLLDNDGRVQAAIDHARKMIVPKGAKRA